MTNQEQQIFFEILQASLWEREPDLSVFQGDWKWCNLLKAYHNHALIGIVANTILNLPNPYLPDLSQQEFIMTFVAKLIQMHQRLNQAIGESFSRLEAAGCHPILLKGQGLVSLYPSTCVRSCGDIDIYIGPDQMSVAKSVFNTQISSEQIEEASQKETHHYTINLDGITYEIHRYSGSAGNLRYLEAFRELSTHALTQDQVTISTLHTPQGTIQVLIPSSEFNIWYIFNHLVQHFREEGVGLRQFCDWLMVLKHYLDVTQTESISVLNTQLNHLGLKRAWMILSGILVHQLGLPASSAPFYDETFAQKSQGYILQEIVNGQNFRFSSLDKTFKTRSYGFRRTLSALRFFYRCSRLLSVISPTYPITAFIRFMNFGLKGFCQRHFSFLFTR